MRTELVIQTLKQATACRGRKHDVVVHSDRGCQYTSHSWHSILKQHNITGSMSGKGNCYDNAIMERFFGTLKDALIVDEPIIDSETMKAKIEQWKVKYNYQRGHVALGGLSPVQFERVSLQKAA